MPPPGSLRHRHHFRFRLITKPVRSRPRSSSPSPTTPCPAPPSSRSVYDSLPVSAPAPALASASASNCPAARAPGPTAPTATPTPTGTAATGTAAAAASSVSAIFTSAGTTTTPAANTAAISTSTPPPEAAAAATAAAATAAGPQWSPFILTRPDDENPHAVACDSPAVFLLFAFDYLLRSDRPPIPQLPAPLHPANLPTRPASAFVPHPPSPTSPATATTASSHVTRSTRSTHPFSSSHPVQPPPPPPYQHQLHHHYHPQQQEQQQYCYQQREQHEHQSLIPSAATDATTTTTATTTATIITQTREAAEAEEAETAIAIATAAATATLPTSPHTPAYPNTRMRRARHARPESPLVEPDASAPFLCDGAVNRTQFVDLCESYLRRQLRLTAGHAPPAPHDPVSVFYGVSPPPISVRDYIRRLLRFSHSSPSTFVVTLELVQRVGRRKAHMRLHNLNMHRLLIASLTVACKLLDDRCFSNAHYARVGGVPSTDEMTTLEVLLLHFLQFNIAVSEAQYHAMVAELVAPPPRGEAGNEVSFIRNSSLVSDERNDARNSTTHSFAQQQQGDPKS